MKIGNPLALWAFVLVPLLIIFYWWAFQRKKLLLDQFVAPHLREKLLLNFSPTAQKLKAFLLVLAITFLILALIRPQWGHHWEEVKRRGVDIMVAIDVSKSMLAQDVSPNRLERAKREVIDLMRLLQGDRLGLIAFAGTSFVQVPLTLDYGAVQIFMNDLDTNLIPIPGTAIAHTIETAVKAFESGEKKSRVLILITDGEDHKGGDPEEAAKKAAEQGIKIYTVGIGDPAGAPIPDERGGFKKDRSGNLVLTKLNEEMLQKVALATGGSYVRSITGELDLTKIYEDIKKTVEEKELQGGKRKFYEERFQWPLILALLVLLLEIFLRERKRRSLATVILVGFLSLFSIPFPPAQAEQWWKSPQERAESAYDHQDYQNALKDLVKLQVEDPKNKALTYNLASTYYQSKDYEKAAQLFSSVAQQGGDLELAQKAYYNLGNTAYRMGKLPEAVEYYQQALKLRPDDQDAQNNLEFVREEIKRRIEENKKQQQERQEQCKNPQQQEQQGQQQEQQQDKQRPKEGEGQQKSQQSEGQEQKEQEPQNKQEKQEEQQQLEKQGKQERPEEKAEKKSEIQKEGQQGDKSGEGSGDKPEGKQQEEEKQAGASSADEGPEKAPKMDAQEVERWLNSLPDSRKEYLQKMMQQQKHYQSEKDW